MSKGNANAVAIEAILGASGSGKTTRLVERLRKRKRKRTVIWSPKEAQDNYASLYPGTEVVNTVADALRVMRGAGRGEFHLVFVPRLIRSQDEKQFSALCQIVTAMEKITFIADELHTVTKPSWSPNGWGQMVMMGRAYGIEIFGLSQRPASVDKNFLGNLSSINVGRLAYEPDCKAVAPALGVPWTEVSKLTGHQWIERQISTGKVTRG